MADGIDEMSGLDPQLRSLATRIMDEEAVPPTIFGREWDELGLFMAMQTYATIKRDSAPRETIMAHCERIGRAKVRMQAEPPMAG